MVRLDSRTNNSSKINRRRSGSRVSYVSSSSSGIRGSMSISGSDGMRFCAV